ncbi:MAG: GNAT family N-acetyltransferase [Bacteroidales bacterium]|jgi:GNAT superfamily N-acetyltransferase|nr:GNAT family N-acetyltransferase [Bacteroidales bacterium]
MEVVNFLENECNLYNLDDFFLSAHFDCGNDDITSFFAHSARNYEVELLCKNYYFALKNNRKKIVCAFSIANDSIEMVHLPGSRKKTVNRNIPRQKQHRRSPAMLIGQMAVSKEFRSKGIGSELLRFVISFIIDRNIAGCRYLVVDALNVTSILKFYERNRFSYLFSTETQEKGYLKNKEMLKTRAMYLDMTHRL